MHHSFSLTTLFHCSCIRHWPTTTFPPRSTCRQPFPAHYAIRSPPQNSSTHAWSFDCCVKVTLPTHPDSMNGDIPSAKVIAHRAVIIVVDVVICRAVAIIIKSVARWRHLTSSLLLQNIVPPRKWLKNPPTHCWLNFLCLLWVVVAIRHRRECRDLVLVASVTILSSSRASRPFLVASVAIMSSWLFFLCFL